MSGNRKCGTKTDGRDTRGRFAAGNPGKAPGTRHKVTRAAEMLLEADAEAVTRKALELALAGDAVALRLCMERLVPPRRPGDRPQDFELPAAPGEAMDAILAAIGSGELLLADAERMVGLIKSKAELATLTDLEARLARLEEAP